MYPTTTADRDVQLGGDGSSTTSVVGGDDPYAQLGADIAPLDAQNNNTDSGQPTPQQPAVSSPEEQQQQQEKQQAEAELENEEIEHLLRELVRKAELEDEDIRPAMLMRCKRNTLYFNNIQKIFYDEVARDYRTIDSAISQMEQLGAADDIKTINVYRAFAESLIAALSVQVPNVEFFPDDSEDPNDIETAEAYSKIAELVTKHTQAPLMLIKALTILFNQGVCAAYNFYKTDPAFGTIKTPATTTVKQVPLVDLRCSNCFEMLDSSIPQDLFVPNTPLQCGNCGATAPGLPFVRIDNITETLAAGEGTPKGRSGFDLFGPTNVKVPLYARNQAGCGYLVLRLEDHIAKWKTVYSSKAEELKAGGGDTYSWERWARMPVDYMGSYGPDITTGRFAWFRPWYYNTLLPEDAAKLFTKYPEGCMVSIIGDVVVDKTHENLDSRWTLTFDPRSDYIHAEPAGNALVPLQDAKNDMFNLGLMSIEFGIPETFAHPKTLNLQKYNSSPNTPGMVSAALPPTPGSTIADGFHTVKTASLSNEYTEFDRGLDQTAQFVTGAFPSIFGGANTSGSKTATEYTESRARALQRLQLTWQMISTFWSQLMSKCVTDYARNLREDEKYSKKQNGTFVNVWIKKSSLSGSVGHVEPEINGQLPQSWAQKKDFMMQLIGMQIPEVATILLNPNNTEKLKQLTGMPDFYIPGENDRNKQFTEFYLLSQQQPVDETTPSIQVDIDVDDHQVHMQVLKNILVDTVGTQLYSTNPAGYQNNILHYRMHEMALRAKTIAPAGGSPEGAPPPSATKTTQG